MQGVGLWTRPSPFEFQIYLLGFREAFREGKAGIVLESAKKKGRIMSTTQDRKTMNTKTEN